MIVMKYIGTVFAMFLSLASYAQKITAEDYDYKKKRDCMEVRMISEDSLAFKPGEKLKYVVNYRWGGISTDVGSATVLLSGFTNEGRPAFHSKVWGSTTPVFDRLFKVRDYYEAKFYGDNCRPIYFHRNVSEGKYRVTNHYYFNDRTHEISARVKKMDYQPLDTILPGRICTFDLLSLFYFSRNMDFDRIPINEEQPISFAIDEEIFELYFKYLGKEVITVKPLGTFRAMKFAARLVAGEVFSGKEEMIIWVTDDRNRVPLLFESPIIVGTVRGKLSGFSGLKFPLESKIK